MTNPTALPPLEGGCLCGRVRYRATPDCPGLMMALDRGGTCKGVLYDLPPADLPAQLDRLFRREFTVKPINSMPRSKERTSWPAST